MRKVFKGIKYLVVGIVALFVVMIIVGIATDDGKPTEEEQAAATATKEEDATAKTVEKEKAKEAAALKAEQDAKKKEEAEAKKAAKAQVKKNQVKSMNNAFVKVIESSNGIIRNIDAQESGDIIQVTVSIDETSWAVSNESEKLSFASTVGQGIKQRVVGNGVSDNIDAVYVDFVSATVGDSLATEKTFGDGYKIKR